jgi:anti-sigma regulatory factor (Ser/Thr protein kinase)
MSEPSGTSQPAALRLALACDFAESRRAAQAVRAFLAQQGCSDSDLMDCELALVEAINNAVKYASPFGRNQPVLVEARCDAQVIQLQVKDHTPGFDWPKKVDLPDPETEHGRGLYLIETLMDSAQYTRNNSENTLLLRKRRGKSAAV